VQVKQQSKDAVDSIVIDVMVSLLAGWHCHCSEKINEAMMGLFSVKSIWQEQGFPVFSTYRVEEPGCRSVDIKKY
jgi:hypothetical protein